MEYKRCRCCKKAIYISGAFLIFGIVWIVLSDFAVAYLAKDANDITDMQTYKGWLFVFVTTVFLFFLSHSLFRSAYKEYIKNIRRIRLYRKTKEVLKRSQEQLCVYDTLLHTIVNSSPDAIFAKDTQGKFILLNKAASKVVGIDTKDAIGTDDYAVFKPEVAKMLQETDKKVIESDKVATFEERTVAKDGREKVFLATKGPVLDKYGNTIGLFGISRDITAQKEHEELLQRSNDKFYKLSHIDNVTYLPNRLYVSETLTQKCIQNEPFCLILLDLDEFKIVNDSYGHRFGDKLLFEISVTIKQMLDAEAFIGRMGGDEFGIILNTGSKKEIRSILQKLHDKFANPFSIDMTDVYITASSGVCIYPEDAKDTGEIYQAADAAMYNAKRIGKNSFSFYDLRFKEEAISQTKIVTNLKQALSLKELELYYQFQNDPRTDLIVGVEALLRWRHGGGVISPDVFIPVAEKSGLIIEIGNFVLLKGFETAALWHEKGIFEGRLSINISVRQLTHIGFIKTLKDLLKRTGCLASWIELEVTESSVLENPTLSIEILQRLKVLGFYISMDDFGTGYSSLSYLKNLPIDKLKIDRSFITDIKNEPKNQVIVKTVIFLSKELGIKVLAEGVENEDELDFLLKNGIDSIQGYYYSKPLPEEETEKLLIQKILVVEHPYKNIYDI